MRTTCLALALAASAAGATLPTGPGQPYPSPCAAVAAALPGDIIEVHPSAAYPAESCTLSAPNLTLRAADPAKPRPSLPAAFTIAATGITIEGLELHSNSTSAIQVAPSATLTLRNCYLHHNQSGLAAVDSPDSEITVESTEFAHNAIHADIGATASLTLRFSYAHHAAAHLIRSRALENLILYNRLTQESGEASTLLAFPSHSRTVLTGNVIQRPAQSACEPMLQSQAGELVAVSNTFVNDGPECTVLETGEAAAELTNNLFQGPGQPDAEFLDPAAHDYRLRSTSPAINAGAELPPALQPEWEYVHPLRAAPRHTIGTPDLGAYEFGSNDPLEADTSSPRNAAAETYIVLSSSSAAPGATADVNLFLFNLGGSASAAAQWTLNYPAGAFTSVTLRPGPAAIAAGKSTRCSANDGRTLTCLLSGDNLTPLKTGIVAIATFQLASTATRGGTTSITLTKPSSATPTGDRISSRTSPGRVIAAMN